MKIEIGASHGGPADSGKKSEPSASGGQPQVAYEPLLRTLHVTLQGAAVKRAGRRILVERADETLIEIPEIRVDQIVIWGNVSLSTPLLWLCMRRGIPIHVLSVKGGLHGCFQGGLGDRARLLRQQILLAEDEAFKLEMARQFVTGKLSNCRAFLRQKARVTEAVRPVFDNLSKLTKRVARTSSVEALFGLEGAAASEYFRCWEILLDPAWRFSRRKRRPPSDPVNSLLSYGYTILYSNAVSLLQTRGLHPCFGYFHAVRDGHAALASDLIEEFRAPVVDSSILALIRRKQLKPDDFELPQSDGQPCLMSPKARALFLEALEKAFNRQIAHPDASVKGCDYRRALEFQCLRVEKAVREGQPTYRPFLVK